MKTAAIGTGQPISRSEFINLLEAQMEIPHGSLSNNPKLAEVEGWDSLASVLFIALADEKTGVRISGKDIARATTVNELMDLVKNGLAA